jgi:cytochrome P450
VAVSGALAADPITTLAELSTPHDPYPVYARLRAASPVYWSDFLDSWVITGYDECLAVLRDSTSFASDWRRIGEDTPEPLLSIQSLDPPAHTRIRHFMVEAVRSLDHTGLEHEIRERVRTRLEALRGRTFDYVTEFAAPLALDTITRILGIPRLDPVWFLPVSQAIVDGMDAGVWPETGPPSVAARARLAELAAGWLDDPPTDGLVGYVAARADGSGIPRQVLLNTLRAVLHAGFESAGRLLGNGLVALLADEGAMARLAAADRTRAVEELVRFDAPVQADSRACVVETRIGEQSIAPGNPVTMLLGAANRDPSRFAEPDTLDFTRHPNPHLGFGRGAHSCLGQPLAIIQARAVFGTLATEYPEIRAVRPPVYRRNLTLRGLAKFDVAIHDSRKE